MQDIHTRLAALAYAHEVDVLFACESGSRAWGIESPDSDFDIRFVYLHPRDWYLQLHERRDVIERTDGLLDFSGWDVRKALRLAHRSNPALLEWLRSQIVYVRDARLDPLFGIMETFSARALMHHYLSLPHRHKKAYWKDGEPVRLKKYLYALRPLFAIAYMHEHGHARPRNAADTPGRTASRGVCQR